MLASKIRPCGAGRAAPALAGPRRVCNINRRVFTSQTLRLISQRLPLGVARVASDRRSEAEQFIGELANTLDAVEGDSPVAASISDLEAQLQAMHVQVWSRLSPHGPASANRTHSCTTPACDACRSATWTTTSTACTAQRSTACWTLTAASSRRATPPARGTSCSSCPPA